MKFGISRALNEILELGFKEDTGFGDITSQSLLSAGRQSGIFTAKSSGVLAGTAAIESGYHLLDPSVDVQLEKQDGEKVEPGDTVAAVNGPVQALLTGERVILNILQHMSGVATATALAAEALRGSPVRICDTRKTLPGLRALQKYAVRCGGGYNHRMRLDSGVMIKDNHIIAAGGIRQAVKAAKAQAGLMVQIEVECESAEQIREAVEAGVDIIMLDNKTPDEAKILCKQIPEHITVELSGGITPGTAGKYRDCGADYLSLGILTHSVQALDISFNLNLNKERT